MPKFNQNQKDAINRAIKLLNEKIKLNDKQDGVMLNNERIQKFVQAKQAIDEFAAQKNPLIKEYINIHKEAEKRSYTLIGRMVKEMKKVAYRQEVLKEAAKLCEDVDEKEGLLYAIEELNHDPAMVAYENYVKGLEYLSGMKEEPEKEVVEFFSEVLHEKLPVDKTKIFEMYRVGIDSWEGDPTVKDEMLTLDDETKELNEEYQKNVAAAKARELFAKSQLEFSLSAIAAQFVDPEVLGSASSLSGFRGRLSPSAFFIGRMLAQNYPLEKILDPNELVEVKKQVGKEYIEHREKKDTTWALEKIYENSPYLMEAVKKYAKEHKSDLQTEEDLVMHGDTMGLLAYLCFDNMQELENIRLKESLKGCYINISEVDSIEMEKKLEKYTYASGMTNNQTIFYELNTIKADWALKEITRQLCMKTMLDEIQKDEPNLENQLLSNDEFVSIKDQIETMEEVKNIFGDEMDINTQSITKDDVKVLASMMSFQFVNDKNLRYHIPRVNVNVKNAPDNLMIGTIEKGQKLEKVVTANGKQLVETDIPAKTEQHLSSLEKKNLRGKESGNSEEFNDMMNSYDETIGKLSDAKLLDDASLRQLAKLKYAATKYIEAKRKQKGHLEAGVPNIAIDNKMLGKDSGKNAEKVKGGSIFTSRGKARYEFALKAIMRVTELENKIREHYDPQMKFAGNMQTFFNDDLNSIDQPIEYQNQNQGMEPIKENPVVESKKEEVVNKDETVVEKITYDDATIKKAKDLLDAMNRIVEEDEMAPHMRLGEVDAGYDKFVPMDFLVNDLKLGTKIEINQKYMEDVMKTLTVITTQEKIKEIETEEIEDEFSLG